MICQFQQECLIPGKDIGENINSRLHPLDTVDISLGDHHRQNNSSVLQRGKDKSNKVCYNPEDLYLPEIVTLCPCGWLYKWCKIITFCSTEHNIHLGPRQQRRQSVQGSCSRIRMHSDLGTWSPALSSQECDAKLESLNAPSLLPGPGRLDWSAAPAAFRS